MGTLIHHENWDGVSAPSIPSGWTASAPVATTATPSGGVTPLSSPNVLACSASGTSNDYPTTYGIADSESGNVLVYASFNAASTTDNQVYGVFARGSAYPLTPGSSSFYWAQIRADTGTLRLYSVVGGVQTLLGLAVTISTLSPGTWYQVQLDCQQSTISVTVIRGDGKYLDSSGNWQSSGQVAITRTDTSITGSGYAGLTLRSKSDNLYSDEWYFYGYAATPQPGPARSWPIVQRARGRGKVIQPLAVRFGTPIVPVAPLSHGTIYIDTSRKRAAINHGWVFRPVPAPTPPPVQTPFAWWNTIRWVDSSVVRRRAAPGLAHTPKRFPPPGVPPVISAINWKSIRWVDPSELKRRVNAGRAWIPQPVVIPGQSIGGGFTQQYITNVNPPVQYGAELFLSWTSNAPAGLAFQVYESGSLVWSGLSTYCTLPLPTGLVRFDIGTVGSSQATFDFSAQLPPIVATHAQLSWIGGTFEGADIAGFHVYGENSAGSGIDFGNSRATIPAYTAGIVTDGFGYGGFGEAGHGQSSASYSWKSDVLSSGTWHFSVVPFDTAGNEGTGTTVAVTIAGPPGEPVPFRDRKRLHYSWSPVTREVTLRWNPSSG
jgi:hypothetical protein